MSTDDRNADSLAHTIRGMLCMSSLMGEDITLVDSVVNDGTNTFISFLVTFQGSNIRISFEAE